MKFQLQSKKFFLTFPKVLTTFDLQQIINKVKLKEKHLNYIIISKEHHKDGSIHYHLLLNYDKRKNVQSPNYFDYIFNKHGHYEKAKSIKDSINYIKKHNDFLEWGSLPSNASQKLEEILSQVKNGNLDAYTIMKEEKLDILPLFNKIGQIDRFEKRLQQMKLETKQRNKLPLKSIDLTPFNGDLQHVLDFINNNLKDRQYKSKMLHLWSREPNTGKTSLINFLYDHFPSYIWPDDMWFQEYKNDVYQFIVWDEFSLYGWQLQFLNRFFAGNKMSLPMKGSHSYKEDNPLIIMTSNQPLKEHIYNKYKTHQKILRETAEKTLSTRIHEIELKSPLFDEFDTWKNTMKQSIKIS